MGSGTTLNMGSRGILFTTEERLALGRMVELSVNWPARLDGVCPLQFVATGRVVRSESDNAAVRIERYEFKTRSSQVYSARGRLNLIAVDCIHREGGQTDGDVFSAFGFRRAIPDPFAAMGDDRLTGAHIHLAAFILDA